MGGISRESPSAQAQAHITAMFVTYQSTHSRDLGFAWGQKGSFTEFRPCQGHELVQESAVETLGGGSWTGGGQLGKGGAGKRVRESVDECTGAGGSRQDCV